jgi:hypothetical protein
MTVPLELGRIVWADIADVNGIRKVRPAVIVTPTAQMTLTGPLDVVAVTSRLADPMPDDHVLLPWHPRGHPRTGLNRKCAAVCSWVCRIASGDVQGSAGVVPGKVLVDILSKVAAFMVPPPSPPTAAGGGPPADPAGGP